MGHIYSLTLCRWIHVLHTTHAYHISKAHNVGISQILKYEGAKSVQQLFHKAQSSCTEQGLK